MAKTKKTIDENINKEAENASLLVNVKIKYNGKHQLPTYKPHPDESDRNSGMDVYANLGNKSVTIGPGERVIIPTGIFVELPKNFEFQVRSRSGLAAKFGIIVLNEPGTIDESYVNKEIGIILYNTNQLTLKEQLLEIFGIKNKNKYFTVEDGDRIAQLVLNYVDKCNWDTNWDTSKAIEDRKGNGFNAGFGHSKIKKSK